MCVILFVLLVLVALLQLQFISTSMMPWRSWHHHFPLRSLVWVQHLITFPSTHKAHLFAEHYSLPRGCLPAVFKEPKRTDLINENREVQYYCNRFQEVLFRDCLTEIFCYLVGEPYGKQTNNGLILDFPAFRLKKSLRFFFFSNNSLINKSS